MKLEDGLLNALLGADPQAERSYDLYAQKANPSSPLHLGQVPGIRKRRIDIFLRLLGNLYLAMVAIGLVHGFVEDGFNTVSEKKKREERFRKFKRGVDVAGVR